MGKVQELRRAVRIELAAYAERHPNNFDTHMAASASMWLLVAAVEVFLRLILVRTSSVVLVQMNGCLRVFRPLMEARILVLRSWTERKVPRRTAGRSMMP